MASDLYHTATTFYPCCVPTLGDSKGAGCTGLASANIKQKIIFYLCLLEYFLMKSIFIRNGLILGILCILLFLITRFGFYDDFLFASAVVNITILPFLFVVTGFFSTWKLSKIINKLSFRKAFSAAYITQMAAGAFFMCFLYLFFNLINPESVQIIRNGLLENLSHIEHPTEDTSFLIDSYKSDYLLSAQFLFLVFLCPIMLPFYGLTSLMMALFFRNK